ncbi:MAG TPA: class I SAM-dependent methyltransferase [Candidatus Solibacter sp.]|nr:class I SAM-dependent methyltransferase [Candidatus Solibacter sp.]
MDPLLQQAARDAIGFMPDDEGLALYQEALTASARGPLLEVGSYCGKSAIYLGAAAAREGSLLFSVDHHRGSEENQPGQQYHDPRLLGGDGRLDTLPHFRAAVSAAGLEETVVAVVGRSATIAASWGTPLAMLFIDGGHSQEAVDADYDGWSRHLLPGGSLAIHDVFPDPRDGGRPPFVVYLRALESGDYDEVSEVGSLRILRRRPRG